MTEKSYFKSILARKLILYIILFSLVVVLLGSSLHLALEYQRDRRQLNYVIDQIKTSQLSSITRSMWVADQELIEIKLNEMLSLPYIEYLEIKDKDETVASVGRRFSDNVITKRYPLYYNFKGRDIELGELYLEASLVAVYRGLISGILINLFVLAGFVLSVALFSFLAFYYLVGRDLKLVADYTRDLNLDNLDVPLELERPGSSQTPDELEIVALSLNEMRENLREEIAKQKRAEQIIVRGKAQFEAIFNSITDALVFVDTKRRIVRINPAFTAIFGYHLDELFGETTKVVYVAPADYENRGRTGFNNDEAGNPEVYEVEFRRKDGSIFIGETLGVKVWDDTGEIIGLLRIIRDVTEKKQIQEEKKRLEANLRQAYKMEALGTMAGGIAHDFNNILAIILGNGDLALDDLGPDHPSRYSIEQIIEAAGRAKELVKQILSFSRQQKEETVPIQPQLLVKETLNLLRSTTPATVSIVERINPECRTIMADPTQFHQLLMNLFNNAVAAMDEMGTVVVELSEEKIIAADLGPDEIAKPGDYAVLKVEDTGAGMDQKTLERIFDPFFTTKEQGKGTGMGLSVVHGIVESYGGFIRVESQPGRGSTFRVYFPVVECRGIIESDVSDEELPTGTEKVLFVDDEKCLAIMGKRILERLGYDVTAGYDGGEALEIFKKTPGLFDILITDQSMPDISGVELIGEVRRIRPDLPIVLCTGFSTKVSAENAEKEGVDVLVMKPYEKKVLAEAIKKALAKHGAGS